MIELLVVIAIATIGVVYTSSTGEEESRAMAEKTAKDALNEAEDQSGLGVLGIDVVARKAKAILRLKDGKVSASVLAQRPRRAPKSEEQAASAAEPDPEELKPLQDLSKGRRNALRNASPAAQDPVAPDAQVEDDHVANAEDLTPEPVIAAAEAAAPAAAAEESRPPATAPAAAHHEEASPAPVRPRRTGPSAPSAARTAALDTSKAPVVEEFDPELDEIVIGYRPGEAGNGRIGIMEDPQRPGSAAVTLGGRCVAVVLGAHGKVMAHHIELVCEEGDIAA
ncbi:hypothetical protein ACRARG_03950 [Pseudooceanicola sp. C21-150M6]|uniref:hypothetical protein n=1 Tax=Pseudooceanicola sp. C21-150M6 TaxID=3434355 RepID=UPI003D7FB52F